MAWRDDKARATLIREAAGSMQPGKTPRAFAELLFDHTNIEDLVNYDAASLAFLAEQAWEHVQRRTAGSADIRVINPMMPDGREISVLEVLNDNMPFLFDSTMAELAEQGIEVALVAHPIIAVERDEQGKLLRFYGETLTEGAKGERESLIHFHIARLDADADRQKLIEGLTKTLNDVRACVTDWRAMRARVEQAIKTFNSNPPPLPIDEVAEANQFLQWLCADNFTFLGLREYRFSSDTDASDEISAGEGLGILRDPDVKVLRRGTEMVVMTPEIREFMREPTVLIVIKANVNSRVHRRVRMDYVGIKLYTPDGRLEGELRLVGLFTSGAYTRSARQIPYVRHKVAQVLERAGFDPDSHSGKAVQHILEEYPRDELFQVDAETLYNFVMEILMLYERPRVRALARADKFDRFVSILVFIPREKYDTDVRTRVAAFLAQVYKGRLSASYASFPEGSLARVHYIIGRYEGETPVIERATLESEISAIAATWGDKLKAALATSTDGMRARMLANRYARAFTGGYTEAFGTAQAIADIATIEKLTPARPVAISVHRIEGEDDPTRFGLKVFSRGAPLSLSYRVPVIENHGLRVVNERTYQIVPSADAGTRAGVAARYDDRGQRRQADRDQPRNSTIAWKPRSWRWWAIAPNPTATTPSFCGQPWAGAKFRPSGRSPATCARSARRSARTICGRLCARTPRSPPALSLCSRPASTRASSPPMPSARHARRPSSPRSRSSSNPSPRSTKTASCAFSPIWCRPPSAPICGRSARTGIRVR